MGLYADGGRGEGAYIRGAYTRGKNEISNFNFSCNLKLLQIIITAQQLMVSPNQSKGQIRSFHRFHFHIPPHPHRRPAT